MYQAIVTDIEGTTSSLSFVKDVLFPYARRHLADFIIAHHRQAPTVEAALNDARAIAGATLDDQAVVAQLLRWIDEDRKVTPLKTLQGLIWEDGYRRGDFQGHIYDDAARALRRWHARGQRLYVYSSGSVLAQQLLFRHTAYGDLTGLFSGYFDTRIGGKREPSSYQAITEAIGIRPETIVFLSDIREELDAARAVGMATRWLVREGPVDHRASHLQARNFDELYL